MSDSNEPTWIEDDQADSYEDDPACPNCDHLLKFHDPEDGSCDVFSGDYKIGVCQCGRQQPVPSPYRFTVSVEEDYDGAWVMVDDALCYGPFATEPEARSHAALVLAALHQAILEGDNL